MKVQEKGTDRRAELHIYKHEQANELAEYGEYIDPADAAICCYAPIENGNTVGVVGRFNGTTLSVHWDLHVDGVLRKANNMISKTVKPQKAIKLDVEEALYLRNDGLGKTKLLETEMKIVPISGYSCTENAFHLETVGTIEVRLYVLRTFGAELARDNFITYLNDGDMCQKKAFYNDIAPNYMIGFETNVPELEKKTANVWNKKLNMKRPSKDPWAIFRFHYRSKKAIDTQGMKLTYNPKTKGKGTEPHTLNLDPVPILTIGANPTKPNDKDSTRDESPTPSRPGTPFKLDSALPRQFILRRPTPPPSPLAQRSSAVEDTPTIVEQNTEKTKQPMQKTKKPTNVEDLSRQKGETTENNTPTPTESVPPTPTLSTLTSTASMLPAFPLTLFTPAPTAPMLPTSHLTLKRPTPLSQTPDPKRSKTLTIAETRRQIKAMKARRETVAKKRVDLDSELEPYTTKMREEQERLARELEEETKIWREESQALRDDAAMLAEMKRVEGEK
ncbi:hypothetical protein PMIN03_009411 [Paraphaeosphaeria minitans]|uniref:Uncharacterized protein n=1 Tax=Paraphaeosphaeria minitans TaxID=565426 RepID=A0A9P6G7L4_9PLEO|nr:hypothetical protein PMIN01_11480 [Paraphaeosphaeria minitans]